MLTIALYFAVFILPDVPVLFPPSLEFHRTSDNGTALPYITMDTAFGIHSKYPDPLLVFRVGSGTFRDYGLEMRGGIRYPSRFGLYCYRWSVLLPPVSALTGVLFPLRVLRVEVRDARHMECGGCFFWVVF